jgi:tungstate transport system ATP-binding protein
MTNQKNIITLDQIFLQIKNKKIFENLSLSFSSKGITVILGPNGSGKTILIKLILGLQKTDKGEIKIVNKKNIKFGYTPQKTILLRRNVFDNIAFPLAMDGCNTNEIFERVNLYLKKFDIYKFKKNSARKLSGGLAQFVSFVRSVVTEPDILILDEPFSNLDASLKNKIENYLINHKLKRKIILVTHDLFQAQRLADEIILMDSGSMVSKSINKKLINSKNVKVKAFLNRNYL